MDRYHARMLKGLQPRLEHAIHMARTMGDFTLASFRGAGLDIDVKPDGTIVTEVDRASETIGRELIQREFPGDGLLGEEHGEHFGNTGWRWVVDPIDGTVSYARGVPLYGVLVGIEHEGVPVGGVVHLPALHETAWGGHDLGAWYQHGDATPCPAQVSNVDRVEDAMVCMTSFDYFRDTGQEAAHERIVRASGSTRGWSDCSAHLLLATGRIDAVIEPLVARWDICAPIAVIEAAGGRCSDFTGRSDPACTAAIASNGHLHEELLELVGNA